MDGSKLAIDLTGVQRTLLIPLAGRVQEAQREGSNYDDPRAQEFLDRLDVDVAPMLAEWKLMATVVGRTKILDKQVAHFMEENRGKAVVVNVGAGLCTRFWRLDDGAVHWIELDLPDVIELKKKLVDETDRYKFLVGDALTEDWFDAIPSAAGQVLFIMEGLVMYFSAEQVKSILGTLGRRYPQSQALIEVMSPLLLHMLGRGTKSVKNMGAKVDFGVSHTRELEALVPELKVLDHWLHADVHPKQWRWLRFFFPWFKPIHACMKVVHVRLGVE